MLDSDIYLQRCPVIHTPTLTNYSIIPLNEIKSITHFRIRPMPKTTQSVSKTVQSIAP